MKKFYRYFFAVIVLYVFCINSRSAITYNRNGGRFGDDLIMYYRAKWIAIKNNIPLLYKPIHHGKNLAVSKLEPHYSKSLEKTFNKVVRIQNEKDPNIDPDANILYVVDWTVTAGARWNDKDFLSVMRTMISPTYNINYIKKPQNAISVAVHVRTGGGFHIDTPREKRRMPLKFPSLDFYINELQRIIDMYKDQNLYVHVFTDHQHPVQIMRHFRNKLLNIDRVTFGCRMKGNRHDANVLDDFFNMMQFDILIYPRSGLSVFAQKFGYQLIAISPHSVVYKNRKDWSVKSVVIIRRVDDKIKKEIVACYNVCEKN